MTSLVDDSIFRTGVANALADFADRQRERLSEIDADAAGMVDTAHDFTHGGKLLRPTFCHAGWLLAGGERSDPRIVQAASAFEWLQSSALVHDDLMDGSDTRRGRPSVHREHEAKHRAAGRVGDPVIHGQQVAVLLGDLMLSWADEALRMAEPSHRALELWDRCKTEVIAGQFLDVQAQTHQSLTVEEALKVVRFKSAKYTIERPLHVGAALAGAGDDLLETLTAVAIPLGEAFQLRDDLLGVYGDPADTGKPAGDDLREGKRTVLVAHATRLGDAELLYSLLGTEDGADRLGDLFTEWGAVAAVEGDILRLSAEADAAIAALGDTAVELLGPLVAAVTRRTR